MRGGDAREYSADAARLQQLTVRVFDVQPWSGPRRGATVVGVRTVGAPAGGVRCAFGEAAAVGAWVGWRGGAAAWAGAASAGAAASGGAACRLRAGWRAGWACSWARLHFSQSLYYTTPFYRVTALPCYSFLHCVVIAI